VPHYMIKTNTSSKRK